jgi:thiol:disulfide interchange protein
MNEQAKRWRSMAPYLVVAVIALVFGSLFVEIFNGEPKKPGVVWEPYASATYNNALQQKKPVMIYFAADWCGPCQMLRKNTFTDRDVMAGSERFVRLRVDLTGPTPESEDAKAGEKFAVTVLPTVIFVGPDGNERIRLRMMGYEEASRFRQRMEAVK